MRINGLAEFFGGGGKTPIVQGFGGIEEPPWDYNFLYNLDEKEYPKYLARIFKDRTGETLDLKHPKTFNKKIQ